jgi:N-acetyl sugar amidotransferase
MNEIKFCKRCLYSFKHPLGITFDEEGICSGCRIHDEKDSLDWELRWKKLEKLVEPYKNKDGRNYDCIIPVSGSQDSYYMVYLTKVKLGLNPLLVSYNKYFNTPLGIENLANLRIKFNCDILYQNINSLSVKKITRSTLRRFGSIYWPILAGQTVYPVQVAVKHEIPLIIWGAHQGIEQVGMFSYEHEVEMSRRYRKDHDLMGIEADDLLLPFDNLKEEDVWQYRYPEDQALKNVGVRGIYLSNFVRWDPKAQHEQMIQDYGYKTAKFERTFDCYDFVDCFNYMDTHDLLKFYKHGYSKVTDHACREIRFGRITREEGINLVKTYEQKPVKYLDQFCKWIGSDIRSMNFLLDLHRNPEYWKKDEQGKWIFSGLSNQLIAGKSPKEELFKATSTIESKLGANYITIGKGV